MLFCFRLRELKWSDVTKGFMISDGSEVGGGDSIRKVCQTMLSEHTGQTAYYAISRVRSHIVQVDEWNIDITLARKIMCSFAYAQIVKSNRWM